MKRKLIMAIIIMGILSLSSCGKQETNNDSSVSTISQTSQIMRQKTLRKKVKKKIISMKKISNRSMHTILPQIVKTKKLLIYEILQVQICMKLIIT